jgi:hypothetical protein
MEIEEYKNILISSFNKSSSYLKISCSQLMKTADLDVGRVPQNQDKLVQIYSSCQRDRSLSPHISLSIG